jgi:signal transduction histidine kinase
LIQGELTLSSKLDHGTTLTFILPNLANVWPLKF